MAADDEGVLLSRGSVRRIKRVVDRFDGGGGPPPDRARGGGGWNPGVQRARATTAITSGSEGSPGGGDAVLLVRDAAGEWGDGPAIEVLNDFSGADVASGKMLRVGWIAGEWWIVSASC